MEVSLDPTDPQRNRFSFADLERRIEDSKKAENPADLAQDPIAEELGQILNDHDGAVSTSRFDLADIAARWCTTHAQYTNADSRKVQEDRYDVTDSFIDEGSSSALDSQNQNQTKRRLFYMCKSGERPRLSAA